MKRTFTLTLSLDSEAFGDDQLEREMEVARILRRLSVVLNTVEVAPIEQVYDRNGKTVGEFEFKQD